MKKMRLLSYGIFLLSLGVFKPIMPMQWVWRGTQAIGAIAASYPSFQYYCDGKKAFSKEAIQERLEQLEDVPSRVEEFAQKELKKQNVPNADSTPIKIAPERYKRYWEGNNFNTKNPWNAENGWAPEEGWAVEKDAIFLVSPHLAEKLDKSLSTLNEDSWSNWLSSQEKIEDEKNYAEKNIALHRSLLKREINHYTNKDGYKSVTPFLWIPIITQTACSGTSTIVKKLFKIKPPKTWHQTLLFSCAAMGSAILKCGFNLALCKDYIKNTQRDYKTRADKFACENAETKQELTEAHKHYSQYKWGLDIKREEHSEREPFHPWPDNRARTIEPYIKKWNEEHTS